MRRAQSMGTQGERVDASCGLSGSPRSQPRARQIDHRCGVLGQRCPALRVDAAGDDVHGVRGEPKVHREVVVGVPVGELVVGGEQLAQTLDRRGCLAVDLHAEQLGGDQHQRVQARVWELAGDYGEGLAEPFRVVATLGDAMRDESEVRLAVGVASCTSDDTTKHPAVPGRPICVRANGHISPIERLEDCLPGSPKQAAWHRPGRAVWGQVVRTPGRGWPSRPRTHHGWSGRPGTVRRCPSRCRVRRWVR